MTSPTTIKNRVSILVNGVTRLANEVFGSDLPVHAHHQHTELDHDDHLQYMLCSAGPSRPFTGIVYFEEGLALRGQVDINFDDHYRALSAYPAPGIPLSLSAAEWTAFIANYGNASIIGAFNTARDPYTAGTGISIANHVVSNTGVISLCKLGQTPSGGAWSVVEGTNITITQDSVNRRLTINGQAGGGAYDDSAVFYHSGSRPGTGNWTLYDGADYHGIGGLTYLRGQAYAESTVSQQVSFTAADGILIEDRVVGSEPDPDRESSITLNQNEAISGAAILVAKLEDADGVLTFGADQAGVYWHDRILRASEDWGAGNPFLLADVIEEVNPYDDLYAALGDRRLPLVNILALLMSNGGSKLEENAVGYGDPDGLLTGDVDLVSFNPSTGLFKVGSSTPDIISAGLFLDEDLEVTGASSLMGGAFIPLLSSLGLGNTPALPSATIAWDVRISPSFEERLLISSDGKIRFTDSGGTLALSSGFEVDYTALSANYSLSNIVGILNSIGISADGGDVKHATVNLVSGSNLTISPVTGGFKFDVSGLGSATLQTAYNAGDNITIGENGPVEILADTATSGRGKTLFLKGTHADRVEPLLDVLNDSTVGGPSAYFEGDAGGTDYGHDLLTDTRLSLHSAFSVDTTSFDGFVSVYRDEAEYDISGVMIKAMCSDASKSAYIDLQCQYSDPGRDTSTIEAYCDSFFLNSGSLSITATGGGAVINSPGDLHISGSGDVLLSAGGAGHFIDLGTNRVKNAVSVSHGTAPTSITYGTTIAANFETGNAFQSCTATGNVTTVTLTPPLGVQACQLMVFASGGARSITGFSGSVSWGEPIDPDIVGYTIPSGEWVIFWLYWNGSSWFGTAIPKFS